MAFAALEGEGLGQIEVATVHVHGDEVALCHLLRHDDSVVGRAIVVGCDGRGLSCGRGGGGSQVDGGRCLDVVQAHLHVGSGQRTFSKASAWLEANVYLTHNVLGLNAHGLG